MSEKSITKNEKKLRFLFPAADSKAEKFGLLFMILLSLLPVIAVFGARALFFLPGLVALICGLVRYFYLGEKTAIPKKMLMIVGAVCGLSLLSYFWAINPDMTISRSIKNLAILGSGVFLIRLALDIPESAIAKYAHLIPAFFFTGMAIISFEYMAGLPIYHLLNGVNEDQHVPLHVLNRGACVLATLFLASVFCLKDVAGKRNIPLMLAALAITAPFFVISASQSAQLAMICGVIVAFLFPYSKKWAWTILQGVTSALIITAPWLAIWLFNNYAANIHALPHMGNGDQGASAGNRLEVWDYVSRYALNSPIYGFGIEATRNVTDFDSAEIYQSGKSILHPHNFALQVWMEFGAIGVAGMCALIIYSFNLIRKNFRYEAQRILLPTLCMIISIAGTGYGMWQGWWVGLILTAAAYSIICARLAQYFKDHKKAT